MFRIVDDIEKYLGERLISRAITRVQLHHTYQPDYAAWNRRPDALYWQNSMRNYHVNTNGWADIAQHFTVCPDGSIVTGRSLDSAPAGITGANAGAVCIEVMGNFDKGGDEMTAAQRGAVTALTGALLRRFGLDGGDVTYHAWWSASGAALGDYVPGRSAKTCPGTNFFGGNTRGSYETHLLPLIRGYLNGEEDLTVTQYEELKAEIAALKAPKMIYDYIDENMPSWARGAVGWAVEKGLIEGTGEGRLGLDDKDLRFLTILHRMQ